jgi:phage gpG-like protein
MVKIPNIPRPTAQEITRSVYGGLGIHTGLTPSLVTTVKWEPTLGIVAGRIDKLGIDIRSFREPLKRAIQQVVIPSIRTNFDVGGRPAWEPWAEDTEEISSRLGKQSTSLLVRTGALRRNMGFFSLWTVTTTSAILNDLPDRIWYGKLHQGGYSGGASSNPKFGTTAAIPARPFVMLQDEDEEDITLVFLDWLEERVNRVWPGV